jgi:hypothetical protein
VRRTDPIEVAQRQRERTQRRLGHLGQGTPHGWTAQGRRLLALAASGRTRNCLGCHKPITPNKLGRRAAYHSGCSDAFYDLYYRAWHITKRVVWKRDDGTCRGCGAGSPESTDPRWKTWRWEYDHIVEIARGGDPLDPENVQLLCSECHRKKTAAFLTKPKYVIAPNQSRLEVEA